MLEFTGGKTFGVNVGELFQFERALHSNRKTNIAPQEQNRAGVGVGGAKCHGLRKVLDNVGHLGRQLEQFFAKAREFGWGARATGFGEHQSK